MFTWNDMVTFVWAFFLTLPVVAFIHSAGHMFFAKLFGGKVKVVLGQGRLLFSLGIFKMRMLYFVDCYSFYDDLKVSSRITRTLVHAGGVIFNLLSIILVNSAISAGYLPKHMFFYQFVYFSLYYIFFDLLPLEYGEGQYSDGKMIWKIWKEGVEIKERSR